MEILCSSLGSLDANRSSYKISDNCLQVLNLIEHELLGNNTTNRKVRFELGKIKAVENHFVHILNSTGSLLSLSPSLSQTMNKKIVHVTVRILVNLTVPLECLSAHLKTQTSVDSTLSPSLEFNRLQSYLLESKKAFLKLNSGTAILVKLLRTPSSPTCVVGEESRESIVKNRVEPGNEDNGFYECPDSAGDRSCHCDDTPDSWAQDMLLTNNCLILLRNLLHVPDSNEFYQFVPFIFKPENNNGSNNPDNVFEGSSTSSRITSKRPKDVTSSFAIPSARSKTRTDNSSARVSSPYATCPTDDTGTQNNISLGDAKWPGEGPREEWQAVYRKLVWNLLAQGLDGTILSLLSSPNHKAMTTSIVQLITLLFKDQNATQLQSMLITGRISESSDEDLESDESSSVQVSSSSSFFSDSSLQSSSQSGSGKVNEIEIGVKTASNDKKNHHLKLNDESKSYIKNPSDSGISSSSSHNSSDQSVTSHDASTNDTGKKGVSFSNTSSCSNNSSSGGDDGHQKSPEEYPITQAQEEQEEVPEASDPENTCCSEAVKQSQKNQSNTGHDGHEGERKTRGEQTSGISNSSEEEQIRVTRKVIKPHHRSTGCKTNESDSSEEYNTKPVGVDTVTVQHSGSISSNNCSRKSKPNSTFQQAKSKCSPSVCLDAAMMTATSCGTNSRSSTSGKDVLSLDLVIAPWNKKKLFSSKNFPLEVDSYVPTNEDIGMLLKDFVVKFLHNSFSDLIIDLKDQLLRLPKSSFDNSHFFWLISYFLKFAVAIDLDYRHVEPLLQMELFGYLVYEGVRLNEQLEMNIIEGKAASARRPSNRVILRKIHLIISALRELFNVVLTYSHKAKTAHTEAAIPDSDTLTELRCNLSQMTDLPQLFLLCIRSFIPTVHSKQFLIEVIITHHISMILLEPMYLEGRFDLPLHLKQFATIKIMDTFGKILQDFMTNTDFVNDCILTMMHHVAGDLMSPDCLFQPIILKTFSLIMESDIEVKECWGDMIEYIMIRFVRAAKKSPAACCRKMFGHESRRSGSTSSSSDKDVVDGVLAAKLESELSLCPVRSDRDRLYWLYLQFEQAADPISMIVDTLIDDYDIPIQKKEVLEQLRSKGIIDDQELSDLKERCQLSDEGLGNEDQQLDTINAENDKIQMLIKDLSGREMKLQVTWIKDCLLKFGAVKLSIPASDTLVSFKCHALAFYSNLLGEPMVIVPFNEKQEMALNDSSFIELLHELGIDSPGKYLYPRIPSILTPISLHKLASKLGKIDDSIFCTRKLHEKK